MAGFYISKKITLFSLLLLCWLPCVSVAQVSLGDFIALRDFYNNTGGPNWTNQTGWSTINTTATPATVNSTWYGLTVTGNRVRRLEITNNNLNGTLSNNISLLTGLTRLVLINEPNLTGTLPNGIGNLTALTDLRINLTGMQGSLPNEIGNLTNLIFFFLIDNDFSGEIPEGISNWTNLVSFIIPFNNFSGSFPFANLSNLSNLTEFRIEGNQFTNGINEIVDALSNFPVLTEFLAYDNNLSGTIPASIANITSLTDIQLNNNQLTGTIPAELGTLPNLRTLYLNNNNLSGTIPAELGNITTLQELRLENNLLEGEIPTELGNLNDLQLLTLGNNQLTGEVPTSLQNLANLATLGLNDNQLINLPDLSALPLTALQVENNLFTFADLEPNNLALNLPTSSYAPQNTSIDLNNDEIVLDEGDTLVLTAIEGGTNTQFEWRVRNQPNPIFTQTGNPDFELSAFSLATAGEYYCVISNALLPALTLESQSASVVLGQVLAPQDLQATADQRTQIDIAWLDISNSEDGYLLERSESNAFNFSEAFNLPANSTNYTDTQITPNITYFYRVQALSNVGIDSEYSNLQGTSISPIINALGEEFEASTQVYPNPTEDFLHLKLTHAYQGELSIALVSAEGKTLKSEKIYKTQKNYEAVLDLNLLADGQYYLKISGKDFSITKTIIKNAK